MGNYTGAMIAEHREYENPSDPDTSDYEVVFEVTAPDAVIDPATAKTLTAILAEKDAAIAEANGDISRLEGEVAEIKLRIDTNITANPFSVTFKTLSGVTVSGVYNATRDTVDF